MLLATEQVDRELSLDSGEITKGSDEGREAQTEVKTGPV